MSAVTNMWRQLVQRRLWPVPILLIVALAAVPLTLAKEPEPVAEVSAAVQTPKGDSELAETPVVVLATDADRAKRRRVLGGKKNPFALPPQTADTATDGSATDPSGGGTATDQTTSGGSTSSGGSSTPTAPTAPTAPSTPATPAPPKKTYDLYDLTVRFGNATDTTGTKKMTLKRLQPLPSAENPVLIYMGVLRDGKTAVFLVDKDVQAVGDGECQPSADACETIRMTVGETEFFDVIDEVGATSEQYQLDLVKIHKGATTSARRARSSYAGSEDGRRVLRAHVASDGPTGFRLDAGTGTLRRADGDLGIVRTSSALLDR